MSEQLRLVLASRSPQRETILSRLGLKFEVIPSGVDELEAGEPRDVVVENSLLKARTVAAQLDDPSALVLGADTVIVHDGDVIGKPRDAAQAAEFMRRLSGQQHQVLGGLAIIGPDDRQRSAVTATTVSFRRLSAEQIDLYVTTGEWQDRSGAYAIQQGGSILVERIEGDYLNIIGMSVNDLARLAPELLG
ncbi:MAG: Maf family protein [Solirubrobacterales bacterium]